MPFINGWYRLIDPRSGNQAGQIKIGVQPLEPLHRVNDRSRPQEIRAVDEDVTEMNDLQQELRQSIAVLESINDRLQGKLRQSLFERKQFHPSISQASRLVHAPMQINQQNSDNDGALQLADLMDDEVAVRHPISAKPLFSGGIDNNGADSQRDIDTLVQNSEAGDSNDGEHSEMGGESSDLRLPRRPLKSLLSPIRDQRSMGTEESKRIGRIFSANFESVVIPPIPSRRPASGILQSQSDDSLERLRNDLDK
jgi:hypothetical protein